MTCSCNSNPCCCNKKRFRGNVDIKQVPGSQGDQGEQGEQGEQGPAGQDGTNGGMVYEHYVIQAQDLNVPQSEVVIPSSAYNISGTDGNYQIHTTAFFTAFPGIDVFMRLYVNGVNVAEGVMGNADNSASNQNPGEVTSPISLLWRGNILNGQAVELRAFAQPSGWAVGLYSDPPYGALCVSNMMMLINKEA